MAARGAAEASPPYSRAPEKTLCFGAVETIGRAGGAVVVADADANANASAAAAGGPLRRSPTPLVRSLAELAQEHQDQLRIVWHETGAGVPDIARDSVEIAASLGDIRAL